MESITIGNHDGEFTNSVDEVDPKEPVVRSYECIFCRRGFTTAQALGGHMNIHRRDRAKSRPIYLSNNISNKQEDHSFYIASCPKTYFSKSRDHNQERTIRYTCFSSTSSDSRPVNHENNHQDHLEVIKSPSMEEKRMSLSLEFGWSHGEDDRESKRRTRKGSNEDELDLELRLGHDP